jgi:hypothetical protein
MSDDGNTLIHHRTVFDGWRLISIALYYLKLRQTIPALADAP